MHRFFSKTSLRRRSLRKLCVLGTIFLAFSVALFADIICEPANAEQVVRLIEGETVVRGETFASENFVRDRIEARVLEGGERLGVEL